MPSPIQEADLLEYFNRLKKLMKSQVDSERMDAAFKAALAKNYADSHGWKGFVYDTP